MQVCINEEYADPPRTLAIKPVCLQLLFVLLVGTIPKNPPCYPVHLGCYNYMYMHLKVILSWAIELMVVGVVYMLSIYNWWSETLHCEHESMFDQYMYTVQYT